MIVFPQFIDENNHLLSVNQLDTFESLWNLKIDWFEEPNYRRNGWSGVSRMELNDDNGRSSAIFIKRQENHNHRTFKHPFDGTPTFRREFINFQSLKKIKVPSLEPLFYAENESQNGAQAILVTQALENYISAEEYFAQPHDIEETHKVLQMMALITRKLHNSRFRHGCLYPKHFFISVKAKNQVDVRLIDLEKLKWLPFQTAIMFNDIKRFIKRRGIIKDDYINYFLRNYLKGPGTDITHTRLGEKLEKILHED